MSARILDDDDVAPYPPGLEAENAALAGLLATIADKRIKRKVQKLLGLGEDAVRALGELDTALYLKEDGESQLPIIADALLSHIRRLLEYLAMIAPEATPEGKPSMLPHRDRPDEERWGTLAREMAAFQYGLGFELKEFERRFGHALANDNREQAVRDLNDATTGLMDGVFALMTQVYECFLGYAEPERMVPGHRNTLGKALAVRRALADLRREVHQLNAHVQAQSPHAEEAYRRIADATLAFTDSDVFAYLRSDTRWEMWEFRERLAAGNASAQRLDCEGYDKYLDSLSFLSQRGVLVKHDTDLRNKIAGDLERAVKFAALLPDVVGDVIAQSFAQADRLAGLSDEIDALVAHWTSLDDDGRVDLALSRRLLELVRPPRAATTGEGDSF